MLNEDLIKFVLILMTIGVVIVSALLIGVAILAFKSYNGGWSHESQEKKAKESKKRRAKKKSSSSDDDSDTGSKVKSGKHTETKKTIRTTK